jgi:hypothetical protein
LELIKDYDLGINYHPGTANVVADTLSQRYHVSQLVVDSMPFELCEEFNKLNLRIVANTEVMEMEVGSSLLQEIWKGQLEDEKIQEIKRNIKEERSPVSKDAGALFLLRVEPRKETCLEPSIRRATILIKTTSFPFANLILAAGPPIDGTHLMMGLWTHGSMLWTRSTAPYAFSIQFSIGK